MPLNFDPETHAYVLDGRVLPSVTQIIGTVLPHQWKAGDWYLNRGRQLHAACALADAGRLDRSSVDPEILPRLEAWEKFRSETPHFEVIASEKPMASSSYQFAGTVDRMFSSGKSIVVCDIKSSLSCQVDLQLSAYGLLWSVSSSKSRIPTQAVAVELRDNGTYACKWLDARQLKTAEQTFLACLTVYNFMAANSLLHKDKDE